MIEQRNRQHFLGSGRKIVVATAALMLLSGCIKMPSSGTPTATVSTSGEPRISESELRAYCPRVNLPDEDAFYTVYERGGEDEPSRIIYRVAIDNITRACHYEQGQIIMEVAAAGRVVPGPKFKPTNLNLPFYVRVRRGEDVLYEKQHQLGVVARVQGQAIQFLFKDDAVAFAQPDARNVFVFVGFSQRKR